MAGKCAHIFKTAAANATEVVDPSGQVCHRTTLVQKLSGLCNEWQQ
jgi:hypothetical protein